MLRGVRVYIPDEQDFWVQAEVLGTTTGEGEDAQAQAQAQNSSTGAEQYLQVKVAPVSCYDGARGNENSGTEASDKGSESDSLRSIKIKWLEKKLKAHGIALEKDEEYLLTTLNELCGVFVLLFEDLPFIVFNCVLIYYGHEILGCSDSRAPLETIFDGRPGDLFICRNAGNTVAAAKGSVIGSMEYSVANLKTKCIIVLGHHKCGAFTAAVQTVKGVATHRKDGTYDLSSMDLEAVPGSIGDVLRDIVDVSAKAIEEMPTAMASDDDGGDAHRMLASEIRYRQPF